MEDINEFKEKLEEEREHELVLRICKLLPLQMINSLLPSYEI